MSIKAVLKGLKPLFVIIGESTKINLAYVESALATSVYPVVRHVGLEVRTGQGALVQDIINFLGVTTHLASMQRQFETIFVHKKTKYPVLHLKPERNYGYVTNFLDIRLASPHATGERFTTKHFDFVGARESIFLFTDYDELDFKEEDIPRLIRDAPGPVYVSTRKRNLSIYEGAAAVVISESDFKLSRSQVSNLIVTLGEDGASFNEKIFSTDKQITGDNFGCREVFFAVLTYAHYFTKDFDYSIKIANRAAGEAAKQRGYPAIDGEIFKNLGKEILEYSVSQ